MGRPPADAPRGRPARLPDWSTTPWTADTDTDLALLRANNADLDVCSHSCSTIIGAHWPQYLGQQCPGSWTLTVSYLSRVCLQPACVSSWLCAFSTYASVSVERHPSEEASCVTCVVRIYDMNKRHGAGLARLR